MGKPRPARSLARRDELPGGLFASAPCRESGFRCAPGLPSWRCCRTGASARRSPCARPMSTPNLLSGEPGRDVRVRLRVDVGVDAERDVRLLSLPARLRVDLLDLALRFGVERQDPGGHAGANLLVGLPDAREHDPIRWESGEEAGAQLAARDDVRPRAERGEELRGSPGWNWPWPRSETRWGTGAKARSNRPKFSSITAAL